MGSRVIYKTDDKNPNFLDIVVGCRIYNSQFIAEIVKGKVRLWHIYPDTKENRDRWGL